MTPGALELQQYCLTTTVYPHSTSWRNPSGSSLTFTFLQNLNRLSHLQGQTLSHWAPEAADYCGEKQRERRKVLKSQLLHWNLWNGAAQKNTATVSAFQVSSYFLISFHFHSNRSIAHKPDEYQSCALVCFYPLCRHCLLVPWQQHDVSTGAWLNTFTVLAVPGSVDVNIPPDCTSAPRKQQTSELLLL